MLYHRNIYWKDDFDKQINIILDNNTNFQFSNHLKNRHDLKHEIDYVKVNNIIHKIKHNHFKPFECETDNNGKVIKFVIRTTYIYNKNHISIVFLNTESCILIKTVWLNRINDKHYTLNKDKYEKGE